MVCLGNRDFFLLLAFVVLLVVIVVLFYQVSISVSSCEAWCYGLLSSVPEPFVLPFNISLS